MPGPATIAYKTHILIGVRGNGVMKVIADWPHLPRQVEVQKEIDAAIDTYTTFALCTPDFHPIGGRARGCQRRVASARRTWPPVRPRLLSGRKGAPEERSP